MPFLLPNIRAKYLLAIGVLPIGLMFAAFLPIWMLVSWLEGGGAWTAILLLFTIVVLMIFGYALGWIVNAVVCKYLLDWPTEKVRSVYLNSNVPAHWLKEGSLNSDTQLMVNWEAQRKAGALYFIAVRGVLAWGGPMFLAMHVVPTLMKGQRVDLASALFSMGLLACGGAIFGAIIWYLSEANYRKLRRRSEA